MNKTAIQCCLLILLGGFGVYERLHAQNIIRIEYFVDVDPGHGNASPLAFTPGNSVDFQEYIDLGNISNGIHSLFFRALDDRGNWSMVQSSYFVKLSGVGGNNRFVRLEYYVDNDPGFGNATPVPILEDETLIFDSTISLSNINNGLHAFYIRAQDHFGRWTIINHSQFVKLTGENKSVITQAEYYIDNDPGIGNGISLALSNSDSTELDLTFQVPTVGLAIGKHIIVVRAKDKYGRWSIFWAENFCTPISPVAAFEHVLLGSELSLSNRSINANSHQWNFGNGQTSTSNHPKIKLPVGIYNVCLTASDNCTSNTECERIEVKGVSSFQPRQGGNAGTVFIVFKGLGFNSNTNASLTRPGFANIEPIGYYRPDSNTLLLNFDLAGKPIGTWNIEFKLNVNEVYYLEGGFDIVEETLDTKVWSEITGPGFVRAGAPVSYKVTYGNNSNNDVGWVPVWLILPKTETPPLIYASIQDPPDTLIDIRLDTVDNFIDFDITKISTDPIYKDEDYDGHLILIPYIPARGSGEISFDYRPPAGQFGFFTMAGKPVFGIPRGNCDDPNDPNQSADDPPKPDFVNCMAELAAQGFVGDQTGVSPPSLGTIDELGQHARDYLQASKYKIDKSNPCWVVDYALNRNRQILAGIKLGAGAIYYGAQEGLGYILDKLPLSEYWGPALSASDCMDGPLDPSTAKESKVFPVQSYDPNDKLGIAGAGEQGFTNAQDFDYTIRFENVDSADVAAQIVNVIDTLDSSVFELSSFALGNVSIGDSIFILPPNLKEYTFDYDLRPRFNLIARCYAKLDTLTGIVRWQFVSLDPITKDTTTDIFAGFLPPNENAPEGEGSVGFSIRLKGNLPHLSVIKNRASIIFDYNSPIITNEWKNTLEIVSPQSNIAAPIWNFMDVLIREKKIKTRFNVQYTDDTSGVNFIQVKGIVNGITDRKVYDLVLADSIPELTLQLDSTYQLYSEVIDSAGNQEPFATNPDLVLKIPSVKVKAKVFLNGCLDLAQQLMRDSLRAKNLIPAFSPYVSIASFGATYPDESVDTTVFNVVGNNAVVDWIYLELRNATDNQQIVSTRSALLQRDGDIVDLSGVESVIFPGIDPGNYYLAIRHRNHLPVMTANPLPFSTAAESVLDFTNSTIATFGQNAQRNSNGVFSMWAGDANGNGNVKYNGSSNDRNTILSMVGLTTPNRVVSGYLPTDLNLDGRVKYNGSSNDRNVILSTVGLGTPNLIVVKQLP